jgi:hypothetical protein
LLCDQLLLSFAHLSFASAQLVFGRANLLLDPG